MLGFATFRPSRAAAKPFFKCQIYLRTPTCTLFYCDTISQRNTQSVRLPFYTSERNVTLPPCKPKHISNEDAGNLARLNLFGSLIGNTDRHQGNISLIPLNEERSRFKLAPVYDMLLIATAATTWFAR